MRMLRLLPLLLVACGDKDDDTATEGDDADDTASDDTGTGDVANTDSCEAVHWMDGSEGTLTITGGEDDVKHHWRMPEGTVRLVGSAEWSDTAWTVEMAMGTGTCPDNGDVLCDGAEATGTTTVTLLASELDRETFEDGEIWFAHLAMLDGAEVGDSTDYSIEVLACTE